MKATVDIPPHLEKKLRSALPDDTDGARKLLLEAGARRGSAANAAKAA